MEWFDNGVATAESIQISPTVIDFYSASAGWTNLAMVLTETTGGLQYTFPTLDETILVSSSGTVVYSGDAKKAAAEKRTIAALHSGRSILSVIAHSQSKRMYQYDCPAPEIYESGVGCVDPDPDPSQGNAYYSSGGGSPVEVIPSPMKPFATPVPVSTECQGQLNTIATDQFNTNLSFLILIGGIGTAIAFPPSTVAQGILYGFTGGSALYGINGNLAAYNRDYSLAQKMGCVPNTPAPNPQP